MRVASSQVTWRSRVARFVAGALLATMAVLVPAAGPSAHANPSDPWDLNQWTVISQSAVSRWNDGTGLQYASYSVAVTWQGKNTAPLTVPTVGDVFYVHIWTEVYNLWSASYRMRVLLPTGLQLATITPQTDVFCGITNFNNQVVRSMPECADPTMFGGYVTFPTVASQVNERLHFWFPVVATQAINGSVMQVLSDQTLAPAVSLPNPTLTEHNIYVQAATATATAPAAPTALAATPGAGTASIAFTPGSNGGALITNYQYSLNGGAWNTLSPADSLSPVTIPGLANGTTYGVQLRAVNSVGAGSASASVSVTPRTTPAAPTSLVATPGNGSATIAFTPGSNGGAGITNYQYSLNGGAWTSLSPADTASPVTIPGLANGTPYSVQLRAANAAGAGAASTSVAVTPRSAPSAPTGLVATAGSGSASIAFTAGANGGAAITNHQYTLNGGTTWTSLSPADAVSPVTVPSLANGTTYSVQLRAVNAAGAGAASSAVAVKPVGAPAAPTSVVAKPGNGAVSLSFVAGANGGAAISNYQYSLNGGAWAALSPADNASPVLVKGLVNGTLYGIRLRAVNSMGTGAASASVSVRPTAVPPSAPTKLVASPRSGAANILFLAGSNGGAGVTNHQYSVNGGAWKSLSPGDASSPIRIPGLTNGVLYSIKIRAVNAKGVGAASAAVSVRPSATVAVPAAPTALVAKAIAGGATITFWPGSDGGSAITNHYYSLNNAPWKALSPADGASPITIKGLAAGATYSIRLRAANVKGAGASSVAVSVKVPATVPGAPTNVQLSSVLVPEQFFPVLLLGTHANAAWTAPATGGSPITSYTVRWWSAPTGGTVLLTCTTSATTCYSVTQMPIFTAYYADVVASNAVGTGPPSARQLYQT